MSIEVALWWILAGIGSTMALAWVYNRYQSRQTGRRLTLLSELGSEAGLSFTSHEKIAYGFIGFDNLKKVLLVLQYDNRRPYWFTIHLEEVSDCLVQTYYRVQPTIAHTYSIDESIDKVVLQFYYKSGGPAAAVPFYCARCHDLGELAGLESKARGWQHFLSKLLATHHSGRA